MLSFGPLVNNGHARGPLPCPWHWDGHDPATLDAEGTARPIQADRIHVGRVDVSVEGLLPDVGIEDILLRRRVQDLRHRIDECLDPGPPLHHPIQTGTANPI